jgi:Na+-transporting methylmalonyl-CoA/oxaloacetate decarboxylase gamma subunit
METFDQAIWITAVGMGLTFAAIGILVLAMVALTRWAQGQKSTSAKADPSSAIPTDETLIELERAAAVAVTVALAQASRRVHPTHAWHSASPEEDPSPWQAFARGQQLEQGKTHQTLRW